MSTDDLGTCRACNKGRLVLACPYCDLGSSHSAHMLALTEQLLAEPLMTEEEAEKAYDEAVPVPLSAERIAEIVDFATAHEPDPKQVPVIDAEAAADAEAFFNHIKGPGASARAQRVLDDHLAALHAVKARKIMEVVRFSRDALDNIGMDVHDVAAMFVTRVKRAEGAPPLLQEIVSAIQGAVSYVLGIPPYVNRNSRIEVAEEDAWSMNAALPREPQ